MDKISQKPYTTTMPCLRPAGLNSDKFVLTDRWVSPKIKVGGADYYLVFQPGYATDGASIPRFFWRLIGHPFQMPLLMCALPHDGLYSGELCPRADADAVLLDLAKRYKISWAKRNAIWSAVRVGGGSVWSGHTAVSVGKSRLLCKLVRPDQLELFIV